MSSKLSALDLAFLSLETEQTPVNIGALQIFEIPEGSSEAFVTDLYEELIKSTPVEPFNLKLSETNPLKLPVWVEDNNIDIEYHVRHYAIPKPGKDKALMDLVSTIHSRVLARERPLWEYHIIDGLKDNRFAVYLKMHHATIDGMGGMAIMDSSFSRNPSAPLKTLWGNNNNENSVQVRNKKIKPLSFRVLSRLNSTIDLTKVALNQGLKAVGILESKAPVVFTAPKTIFNVPISSSRRFSAGTIALSDLKKVAKSANSTVNDVVLSIVAGSLRRYLSELNALPSKSLIASIPVSVRKSSLRGNQITYISADLSTNIPDPVSRLHLIRESTNEAKKEIHDISTNAAITFAVAAQGLVAFLNKFNLVELLPPAANVVISNVPGPKDTLYLGRAKLLSNYPLSVLINGQALNITVVSYGDSVNFGLIACRKAVPDVDRIKEYIRESFEELRSSLDLKSSNKKTKKMGAEVCLS